jgi:hypothetical protein
VTVLRIQVTLLFKYCLYCNKSVGHSRFTLLASEGSAVDSLVRLSVLGGFVGICLSFFCFRLLRMVF